MIQPGAEIFLVICMDRHVDPMITAHTTRQSADAEIATFQAEYGSRYKWAESDCGRDDGWIRCVDTSCEDGPYAYIQSTTLRGDDVVAGGTP